MQSLKLTALFLSVTALVVLATACAPAPTPTPTAVPPTPTPVPPPPTAIQPPAPTAVPATIAPTSAPTKPSAATAPTSAAATAANAAALTGASLYQLSCASCHGANGQGSTFKDKDQTISVPSLGWDDLNTMYQTKPSRGTVEQQLALAITKGQDEQGEAMSEMMPRWSSLSQAQVDGLVQYIKTGIAAKGAAPTLTTAALNLKGEQLYQAACASCHSRDGAGETFKRSGNTISTPSLRWSELTQMYSAMPSRGTAEQQFAVAITQGQDETGADLNPMMPRWSSFSQAQVDSLAQYIETTFK